MDARSASSALSDDHCCGGPGAKNEFTASDGLKSMTLSPKSYCVTSVHDPFPVVTKMLPALLTAGPEGPQIPPWLSVGVSCHVA